MNGKTLIARVTITTEGPLSIAMPKAEFIQPNQWKNFPVMTRGLDEDGRPKQTAYLPASTVRGALRRGAVLPSMRAAAAAGTPYSLQRAYSELIGQDANSELQPDEIDLLLIQRLREDSPVVDLFGSGLGVKSRLKVSHFLPEVNILPEAFTGVRKDVGDTEDALDYLDETDRATYLARSQANRKRAQAVSLLENLNKKKKRGKDLPPDIDDQIAAADGLLAKYADDMGDMKNSSRTIVQHFALAAGLSLKGKLVIDGYQERDMAVLLAGLDAISQWPILGAQSARGCGEISGVADIEIARELVMSVRFGGYEPIRIAEFGATENAE
jgi:hypothetical protein